MIVKNVAVLFARRDSVYKSFELADVYDEERDARNLTPPPLAAWLFNLAVLCGSAK